MQIKNFSLGFRVGKFRDGGFLNIVYGFFRAQIGSKWLERALKILAYSNFTRIHLRGLIFYVVNLW